MIYPAELSAVEVTLTILAFVAMLSYAGSTVLYGVYAPWQKTWVGRLMLLKMSVTTVSFILIIFLRNAEWVQDYRDLIRLGIFGAFAVAGVGLFLAILTNQLDHRKQYKRRKNVFRQNKKGTAMARHELAVPSTQLQFPNRSAIRTAVQAGIPAFLSGVVLLPWIIDMVLDTYGQSMPDSVRVWLLGFAAFITATAALASKIMANPAVDAWIREHLKGLAPSLPVDAPKQEVVVEPVNPTPPVAQEPTAPPYPEGGKPGVYPEG